MLNICLVEDNEKIGKLLQQELIYQGYQCDRYTNIEAIDIHVAIKYHIFLLDVMLPGQSGISFCKEMRDKSNVGIIMLTAKSTLDDKIAGFDAGADDYITKPFKTKELCMRIDALAERLDPKTFFQYFDVRIDCKNRIANVKEQRTHLTPTEREVIEALIDNRGVVCMRADLIDKIRGTDDMFSMNRSLDVVIANIRKKLGKRFIETVPATGYRLGSKEKEES